MKTPISYLSVNSTELSVLDRLRMECEIHLIADKKQAALLSYNEMLTISPTPFLFVAKAKLLESMGNYTEAVENFEMALRQSYTAKEDKLEVIRLILDLDSTASSGILKPIAQYILAGDTVQKAKTKVMSQEAIKTLTMNKDTEATVVMNGKEQQPLTAVESATKTILAPPTGIDQTPPSANGSRMPSLNAAVQPPLPIATTQSPGQRRDPHDPNATILEKTALASPVSIPIGPQDHTELVGSQLELAARADASLGQSLHKEGSLDTGAMFGRYKIVRKLGQGGMGTVYQAHDISLDRVVALKIVSGPAGMEGTLARRFLQEVKATAKLQHPNIIGIYDFGDVPQHYFTMEYIDGTTLAAVIQEGIVKSKKAATILLAVCEAIATAHEAKIIHRDLKPSNIMIAHDGMVKVMDFGLAKFLEGDSQLSRSGDIIGTPAYMSPEQAAGGKVDERSDVYSIGAVGYEMITGKPLFQGDTVLQILAQVANQDPRSPKSLNVNVAMDLEVILLKCVEKSPAKRYPHVAALRDDLQRYLDNKPILAKPPTWITKSNKWVKRNVWLTVAVMTIAISLITAGVYLLEEWFEQKQESRAMIILYNMTRWNKEAVPYDTVSKEFQKALTLSDSFIVYQAWGQFCLDYARLYPHNSRRFYLLGIELFLKSLERNPDDYISCYFLYILCRLAGKDLEAEQYIQRVWKIVERQEQENEFRYAGAGLQDAHQAKIGPPEKKAEWLAKALHNFDVALGYNPYMFCVYNFRGELLLENKKYEQAEMSLNRSLGINPIYRDALANRGRLYLTRGYELQLQQDARSQQDLQKAQADFTKILEQARLLGIQPEAQVHYHLACVYAVQGDAETALKYLVLALNMGLTGINWAQESKLDSLKSHAEFQTLLRQRGQ